MVSLWLLCNSLYHLTSTFNINTGQKFAMMEDKIILASILRRFSIKSIQTIDEAKPAGQLILRPAEGNMLVNLSRRK